MKDVENSIGYEFKKKYLLTQALTHSSYANEKRTKSYERLEFLGDSVLSVIISEHIFKRMRNVSEGDLTKFRALLVCEHSLAETAKKISLDKYMLLGKGEELTGGRNRESIISDVFESVLAAIYLDGGMKKARGWLLNLMENSIEEVLSGKKYNDYKTMLQETVQKGNEGKVTYQTIKETGMDHDKHFVVEVLIDGKSKRVGEGQSKKEAEQAAAHKVLRDLGKDV